MPKKRPTAAASTEIPDAALETLYSPGGHVLLLGSEESGALHLRVSMRFTDWSLEEPVLPSTGMKVVARPVTLSFDLQASEGGVFAYLVAPVLCGAEIAVLPDHRDLLLSTFRGVIASPPAAFELPRQQEEEVSPYALAALRELAASMEQGRAEERGKTLSYQLSEPPWPGPLAPARETPAPKEGRPVVRQGSGEPPSGPSSDHLLIPSPGHYHALQQALALNTFQRVEGTRFPRADLGKGGARGYAELRPVSPEQELLMSPDEADALAQRVWQQREELSDKDADTLDAISAEWLRRARKPTDRAGIYIDELLKARGLKPKKGGSGRRGGFEPEQRRDLWRCLLHLQELWLDIAEAVVVEKDARGKRSRKTRTLQSRAFVMTDRVGQRRLDGTMDVEAILVSPGEAFGRFLLGPGRQVALLSSKALEYDPMRHQPEKRLARFLSWQWRVGAHKGDFLRSYRVQTLLEEIGQDLSPRHPSRTRQRVEQAMDRLQSDGVIAAWQYEEGWSEDKLPRQRWFPIWLNVRLVVEAPDPIKEAYRNLDQLVATPAAIAAAATWGDRLRQRREQLGLSQLQAAEALGISQPYVAQIERGRKPSRRVERLLTAWLEEGQP